MYINENYRNINLSLEEVATELSLSVYSLSRFFKEQTGVTFTDYLIRLRMDEAKRLLRETDATIKDIVQSIGYMDAPNFMRKFKILEGVTLGEYRKLHKSK